jgi:hypothetical protein
MPGGFSTLFSSIGALTELEAAFFIDDPLHVLHRNHRGIGGHIDRRKPSRAALLSFGRWGQTPTDQRGHNLP